MVPESYSDFVVFHLHSAKPNNKRPNESKERRSSNGPVDSSESPGPTALFRCSFFAWGCPVLKELLATKTWHNDEITLNNTELWKRKRRVLLLTDVHVETDNVFEMRPGSLSELYPGQLLKSAMQKAVRRGLHATAVRVALQLLIQDPISFLRRLPVVVMEDSILDRGMAAVVWLVMASTKGWKLSRSQVDFLLWVVYCAALCPFREIVPEPASPPENPFSSDPAQAVFREEALSPTDPSFPDAAQEGVEAKELESCVAALWLRATYGGMPGDVLFLCGFADRWCRRLSSCNRSQWLQLLDRPVPEQHHARFSQLVNNAYAQLDKAPPRRVLRKEDKLLAAVDFHCFGDRFVREVGAMVKDRSHGRLVLTDDEIRKGIWWHRSAVYVGKQYVCRREDELFVSISARDELHDLMRQETLHFWLAMRDGIDDLCASKWKPLAEPSFQMPLSAGKRTTGFQGKRTSKRTSKRAKDNASALNHTLDLWMVQPNQVPRQTRTMSQSTRV